MFPQEHVSFDRQAGQALCRLDGGNARPHSLQVRIMPG